MELILNTFGVSLGRENEGFIVTSPEGKQRIPADAIKSIQICKGVHITSDAVFLAIDVKGLRSRFEKAPRIVMCFMSPSEDELKLIFKLQEKYYDHNLYKIFYKVFCQKFSAEFNQLAVDLIRMYIHDNVE